MAGRCPRKSLEIVTFPNDLNFDEIDMESPINLKQKLSQLNKTLFKTKISQNRIEKLEKDAIRGEGAEKPEPKSPSKIIHKPDLLTLILKSEHKTTNKGTQILRLPKLPYGKHHSYNEDISFKDRHFLDGAELEENAEKAKELSVITRKFRLHEKKYKANKRNRLLSAKPVFSGFGRYDMHDMGPGSLICDKQEELMASYDKDKEKYKETSRGSYKYTFKDMDEEGFVEKYIRRKKLNGKEEKELLSRILPSRETKESSLSQFYSTKYSSLFESFENTNRNEID